MLTPRSRRRTMLALLLALLPAVSFGQTSYTLAPVARQAFFDGNGNPAASYKLCTYASGSSTPAATYSDTAGTLNSNPIVLNAAGRPSNGASEVGIYLSQSSYKFVLLTPGTDTTCNTGTVVWSQDVVTATPASSANVDVTGTAGESISAGQVAYLSDGSGGKTAGRWYKADSTNTYSSTTPEIGIALAAITSGQSGSLRVSGEVTGLSSLSAGANYYASTAGAITASPPSNRRFVGAANSTTSLIVAGTLPLSSALADGAVLTALNASNLASGTVPVPRVATVLTTTSTGTQNDFSPGTLAGPVVLVRCNNASDLTLTGLTAGTDGQIVVIASIGVGHVFFKHQHTGSAAVNRLANFATSGDTPLAAGVGTATYQYDATTQRWRLITHDQGAWITPTFNAANYTASTGTWTLDAGDVTTQKYYLRGRNLIVAWYLVSTTVSATPATLSIGNGAYGGLTASGSVSQLQPMLFNDNGGGNTIGFCVQAASSISLSKLTGNWSAATNQTHQFGELTFEVQ